MRAIAFASALALPRQTTPWLLLREERYNAGKSSTLPALRLVASEDIIPFTLYQAVTTQFEDLLTPLSGPFSTFARATNSLSVLAQYLALEVDTPVFMPDT